MACNTLNNYRFKDGSFVGYIGVSDTLCEGASTGMMGARRRVVVDIACSVTF